MNHIFKQTVVTLLFAGMLLAVWALNKDDKAEDLGKEEALKRYGFYFEESAKKCGIDFTHGSPQKLDQKLSHILPIIASMGASVTVVDYDKDGWLDLYVVTSREGGLNRLYHNNGDGTFRDVAQELGIADLNKEGTGVCQGAVWGDFDNDGYEDLFVYKWGKPELFRNIQGKRFERVDNDKAGIPNWINANSAIWIDFDCDGRLDLFIAGYWRDDIDLWNLKSSEMMPESFEYAKNGGRKYLLRNLGEGKFEDVTDKVGIKSTRWTLGVAAADLCGSGYPDIILANDYGVSEFLCNKQGKKFEEIGDSTGIGKTPKSGMNVTLGDIFNNGRLAIYVTNITEPGNLVQGNNLWVPDANEPGKPPKYVNQATQLKVDRGGWSWGAQFGDLKNSGTLDLYMTNGYISANERENYWYEYGLIAGGNKLIIGDAKNWPAIKGRSLSGYQTKCVWWNKGGEFIDIARAVGISDKYDGRAVVMADLFNRGMLDVVVANQNGPLLLYKNNVAPGRDWVQVELEGTKSNRSAIGALVRIYWRNEGSDRVREQVQTVSGGNGYASQNMRRLHFGLGEKAKIDKIVIQWPAGPDAKQVVEAPKSNVILKIKEDVR
jgi:enediyne biosynthesis protein E4